MATMRGQKVRRHRPSYHRACRRQGCRRQTAWTPLPPVPQELQHQELHRNVCEPHNRSRCPPAAAQGQRAHRAGEALQPLKTLMDTVVTIQRMCTAVVMNALAPVLIDLVPRTPSTIVPDLVHRDPLTTFTRRAPEEHSTRTVGWVCQMRAGALAAEPCRGAEL